MAADEYFDAIGDVLSYVLSAEDKIVGQRSAESGKYFILNRDGTHLEFFAKPDNRYFTIMQQFSLTNILSDAYEEETQLARGHIEEYGIDESEFRDRYLYEKVAYERVKDVSEGEANKLITDIKSHLIHSGCRIESLEKDDPDPREKEEEIWDGVYVIGLLYPYEDSFSPRDYEEVAQEVISVGNQVEKSMESLEVLNQIGFSST
jgi:hypothetical protein